MNLLLLLKWYFYIHQCVLSNYKQVFQNVIKYNHVQQIMFDNHRENYYFSSSFRNSNPLFITAKSKKWKFLTNLSCLMSFFTNIYTHNSVYISVVINISKYVIRTIKTCTCRGSCTTGISLDNIIYDQSSF